eukprot:TRINITY_DN75287_c0_g1_i1.p1 TRINITY_DN75287_c0_g1~~TRINITY_DN75287_c0_g1_i1.p1  ORF type:complete len:415 (-),score=91.79 TRINITY_DN75287_c0_g1_i1:195-1439(-)
MGGGGLGRGGWRGRGGRGGVGFRDGGGKGGGRGGGKGRGRGGFAGHDNRSSTAVRDDKFQKNRRGSAAPHRGRGRGRGTGGAALRSITNDAISTWRRGKQERRATVPTVDRVDAEFLLKHCEVQKAHGSCITNITMTAQGIYTASTDKLLKRWAPQKNAEQRFELKEDLKVPLEESCHCMLYKEGWIFCGLWNGTIMAFSQDGSNMKLEGHRKKVSAIILHENVLISGGFDQEVRLWQMDPNTKAFACTHTIKDGTPGSINRLTVLGSSLFIGGQNGIAICNLQSLTINKIIPPVKHVSDFLQFQGHLVASYTDGTLRVFNAEGELQKELKESGAGAVVSMAGLESGPRIVCTHNRGQVSTIELPVFEFKLQFQPFENGRIETVTCAGHDGIFLIGHQNGALQLWQRLPPPGAT